MHINLPYNDEPDISGEGSIFFIGTATTIIRFGGLTLLTDPNFLHAGDHVHLGYGLTAKRLTNPAIDIEELPPLDICILSHMHGDHWDHIANEKLRKNLPIITTFAAAKVLRKNGFSQVYALKTWDSVTVSKHNTELEITALPGQHGPKLIRKLLPPVNGHFIKWHIKDKHKTFCLYISGDTLIHKEFKKIPSRFPNIDLALLHLGGTRLLGILLTMNARQGINAIKILQPKAVIPIHYNDYTVFKSSIEDFLKAVDDNKLANKTYYLKHGEVFNFKNYLLDLK